MRRFSLLEYSILTGYLLLVAVLGASFYRRKATARDYFLGGRSMSWLPVGISIVAADLSAITLYGSAGLGLSQRSPAHLDVLRIAFGGARHDLDFHSVLFQPESLYGV